MLGVVWRFDACQCPLNDVTMNNGSSQPSANAYQTRHKCLWHPGPRSCLVNSCMPCLSRSHIQLQSYFYKGSVTSRQWNPLAVVSQDTE